MPEDATIAHPDPSVQDKAAAQIAHAPGPATLRVFRDAGVISITDANTTIGYCRYNGDGEVEYLFVHPAHRRRGHALRMLKLVEAECGGPLRFQPPISPLGQRLIDAYSR